LFSGRLVTLHKREFLEVKRAIISLAAATALAVAPISAMAQTTAPQTQAAAPLPAGNAAGVKQAQGIGNMPWLFWAGSAVVLVFAVLLVLQDNDDVSTVTTTTVAP
jgi:hypothetical protein